MVVSAHSRGRVVPHRHRHDCKQTNEQCQRKIRETATRVDEVRQKWRDSECSSVQFGWRRSIEPVYAFSVAKTFGRTYFRSLKFHSPRCSSCLNSLARQCKFSARHIFRRSKIRGTLPPPHWRQIRSPSRQNRQPWRQNGTPCRQNRAPSRQTSRDFRQRS